MIPYNFITIEGTIGAGKTTLATKLANEYNAKLILEQFEDNPFLPGFYQDPERHAFPVELYFMAERFQHLKKLLSEGDIFSRFTVSDFLFHKSLIFATQNLKRDEERLYRMLFDIINPSLPKPDLVVYLYAPVEKLLSNIHRRGRDYEQGITADYLHKIQQAYLEFFKQQPYPRIVLVDTTNLNWADNSSDYQAMQQLFQTSFAPGIHYL